MTRPPAAARPAYFDVDFDRMPFTIAWEITRACALACVHCRAEAISRRDPMELLTDEAFRVIDQVVEIGRPILVVTGGDPMMRRDVFDILEYAAGRGLKLGFSPSATALLRRSAIERVRDIGVEMMHISLDGSTPAVHDGFRQVEGVYARTMRILRDARELGLPLQIGTTVGRHNFDDLPAIAERVAEAGAIVWSVFFIVPTGRAQREQMLTAQEHEQALTWLAELSERVPFRVRTTAAQHYRRILIQRARAHAHDAALPPLDLTGAGYAFREGRAPAAKGVNDGNGFCFISHTGDIYPSGFLQLSAGNVRERSLADVYRNAPLFRNLRNPSLLKGKCGRCGFREICGGSRARAYALTGDPLAEDPSCAYVP